jgi:hypothetical protein
MSKNYFKVVIDNKEYGVKLTMGTLSTMDEALGEEHTTIFEDIEKKPSKQLKLIAAITWAGIKENFRIKGEEMPEALTIEFILSKLKEIENPADLHEISTLFFDWLTVPSELQLPTGNDQPKAEGGKKKINRPFQFKKV